MERGVFFGVLPACIIFRMDGPKFKMPSLKATLTAAMLATAPDAVAQQQAPTEQVTPDQ